MRVLAGDIGGTNARLAVVDIDKHGAEVVHERRFESRTFPDLTSIVRAFLAGVPEAPRLACFGIAGPVVDGHCHSVNLPWTVDEGILAAQIGIPRTTIVNDLHAAARGVPCMGPRDLVTLQAGVRQDHGVMAVIGAGTGLGEAFLTWDGAAYRVHDSEGGHATFGSRNDLECDLLRWLSRRFGHVSRERVVSGPGLVSIYHYLVERGGDPESPLVRAEIDDGNPAAVISHHALEMSDPICTKALDLFVSAYGAQAANLALTVMAAGGVYVTGGIAPRILPKLRDGTFIAAFRDKGRLASILTRVPVNVIVNPHIGLIGAAAVAIDLHAREPTEHYREVA